MRVLQVNKFNYLKGGAAKYFLEVSRLLEQRGVTVAKFSMKDSQNLPDQNEKYFVSHIDFNHPSVKDRFKSVGRILWSREAARKFEKLIKEFNPDLVHLHNIYHQLSPSIIRVAKKHNLPIVMHLHDYKLICPNYKLFTQNEICYRCQGGKYYNCLKNKCVKDSYLKSGLATIEAYFHSLIKIYDQVDLFIAPSQFMKDTCVAFGIPANKIVVLHNFAETEKYEKLIQITEENYLLYFGRLSEEKGIETAIEALSKIADSNLVLKIAGSGPEEKKLKELTKKLGLEKRIEFLGFCEGEKLLDLIGKAKAILIPSVWNEVISLSLIESLASGKVVIISNVGGMPELVKEGKNGFLFAPGNVEELAQKINSLDKLTSENLAALKRNAQQSASELNAQKHIEKIMGIYQRLEH